MISERLRLLLDINKLKIKDFAKETDITTAAVYNYLNGRVPRKEILEKMSIVLNVPISYLLGYDNDIIKDEFTKSEAIRDFLIDCEFIDNKEKLTDEMVEQLKKFIKINKDFIK